MSFDKTSANRYSSHMNGKTAVMNFAYESNNKMIKESLNGLFPFHAVVECSNYNSCLVF